MPPVRVSRESVVYPTYAPATPDRNPMFLEKRVYQGSSGRVYPLPFTDRIEEKPTPRAWDAVILENDYLYVMVLPELGGRIHVGRDKTNGYDFFYRQDVIKPALVGLAGPWISGGVEFNWPQHHRPSTFMPADVQIEKHDDGAVTVWLSEHDPMARMKGMHGVCLRPDSSAIELKARVYNRTPHPQTFLWWANVATRVHEQYQSFFPPDVTFVADHAKRATSRFPLCEDHYYGVDYAAAATTQSQFPTTNYSANDLSWYANIPVPTSYMAMGSRENFFGGYDHRARAGVIHIANHHISPGKKQWTWGNHEFGYAWDRNLTAPDANGVSHPYIEIMAGVYTDNQPDFSFLQPGETKSWSQFWYPIQQIGPAQHANLDAALSLTVDGRTGRLGVSTSRTFTGSTIELRQGNRVLKTFSADLAPGQPFTAKIQLPRTIAETDLTLAVADQTGRQVIAYTPLKITPATETEIAKVAATEPPLPAKVPNADELFLIGQHLAQYRHATRCPTLYWREALRRDPSDSRCHTAHGKWHLQRGEFATAEQHFRSVIARLTSRNPNPSDGEAHYHLGLTLRYRALTLSLQPAAQPLLNDAYAALYKATWNQAWASAAYHALAEIDATRSDWATALDHLDRSLRLNTDNLRARNLRVIALRRLGRDDEATAALRATLALDPLDWWARHLVDEPLTCDNQVRLDLAHDHLRAGLFTEALALLAPAAPDSLSSAQISRPATQGVCHLLNDKLSETDAQNPAKNTPVFRGNPANLGTAPLVAYTAAWVCHLLNDKRSGRQWLETARAASPDYCFPARLEELLVLEFASVASTRDARAPFFLGHLLYDRRRHREAISHWERAVKLEPANAVAWRCLGIGYFNNLLKPTKARVAYEKAFRADPRDARLLFERDQLWKRLGEKPARRLRELERHRALVDQRDDLSVELCALYNQTGQPACALEIVSTRKFQPWEGGEGQALGQHVRTHLALGRVALSTAEPARAIAHFQSAATAPENLGEARHPLANQSDIHFWLGEALAADGRTNEARQYWIAAANFKGDFQAMSVRQFSEMTYYSALSLLRLRQASTAKKLLRDLLRYAKQLARTPAKIDYFATSLPTMLLFDDDLQARQQTTAIFLEAQARFCLGQRAASRKLLHTVLARDPSHALAADLLAQF